jgi:hypothetical protein
MPFCPKCEKQVEENASFCPSCGAPLTQQLTQPAHIIAEFHYWDYGEYSRNAMEPSPEIKAEDLEKIAKEFNVNVSVKRGLTAYITPMSWRPSSYGKIVIQVTGKNSEDVKVCVGRIFLRYGKPDEIPTALFGEKKEGKRIIEDLLKEYEGGKR